jgi:hypothetical protein
MPRIWLRTFTIPPPPQKSHSFLVSSTPGGLSPRLSSYVIDPDEKFSTFRARVEIQMDRGMQRRTTLYQEILYLCLNLENDIGGTGGNPHEYTEAQMRGGYRFATMENVGGREEESSTKDPETGEIIGMKMPPTEARPILIKLEDEDQRTIMEIIPNLLDVDVIIVPLTQVRKEDDIVTNIRWAEVAALAAAAKKKEEEAYIASIDLSKYDGKTGSEGVGAIESGASPTKKSGKKKGGADDLGDEEQAMIEADM